MIDVREIAEKLKIKYYFHDVGEFMSETVIEIDDVQNIVNQAIKDIIPQILTEVAEKAEMELRAYKESGEYETLNLGQEVITERENEYFGVDKSFISNLQSQLEEKLLK